MPTSQTSATTSLARTILLDSGFRLPLVITGSMLALALGMLLTAALVG